MKLLSYGISHPLGIIFGTLLSIVLIILVFLISFSTSTSILAATGKILAPSSTPVVFYDTYNSSHILLIYTYMVLSNPSDNNITIDELIIAGHTITLDTRINPKETKSIELDLTSYNIVIEKKFAYAGYIELSIKTSLGAETMYAMMINASTSLPVRLLSLTTVTHNGVAYALCATIYAKNTSITITGLSLVGSNGTYTLTPLTQVTIPAGKIGTVRFYSTTPIPPGTYTYIIEASNVNLSGTIKLRATSPTGKAVIASTILRDIPPGVLTINNTLVEFQVNVTLVNSDAGLYRVEFKVTPSQGHTVYYVIAELFNNTLQHPKYVGGNPWAYTSPYSWPLWAGAYWTPVTQKELPITIVFSVDVS